MSFLKFLKRELPQEWEITEELNIDWDGIQPTLILKSLTGTIYKDSIAVPIQLVLLTSKPLDDKMILDKFIAKNHNTYFVDGINTYIKQQYLSPIVPVIATPTGNQLTNQIIVSGTLLKCDDVSDVKEIKINGELQGVADASLGLSTDAESNVRIFGNNPHIAQATVKKATINLEFSIVNKNNNFCNDLKRLRNGSLDLDTIFNVDITFTDDSIERYAMKVVSFTLSPSVMALPVTKVMMSAWKVGV